MKMYRSVVELNGVKKNVICVNIKADTKKDVEVDRLHHIHVLDRSYSMSGHLDRLIENVKETLDNMADNDLISVIWFSSEDQCEILLKGASKSDDVKKILDTIKSPVGCTCFSEPLKKVNKVIDDLSVLCSNFSITFFTDGETVTTHSKQEEENRIFEQIGSMKDKIMALNCIGYGHYYNEELLQRMAAESVFGKLVHSNKIDEYKDIWTHTYSVLSDMVLEKTVVEVSESEEIIYLTNKSTKLQKGKLELNFMNKIKNQIFLFLDVTTKQFKINDETFNVDDILSIIPTPSMKNGLYSLGYEYAYAGRTEEALDIYANILMDKAFVDDLIKAFSVDEREEIKKALKKAIFSNPKRLKKGKCKEGYLPKEDAFCVMDLLQMLAKNERNLMFWTSDYNRIGLKTEEGFVNLFRKTDKETLTSFSNITFNEKSLNASIRFMINGEVSLNPNQADRVNLPHTIESKMYRMQTIIKDGHLNIPVIKVRMNMDTYVELMDKLKKERIDGVITRKRLPMEHEGSAKGKKISDCWVDIDVVLSDLPIINKKYAKDANDLNIVQKLVCEIEYAKAAQKVIKYYIDSLKPEQGEIVNKDFIVSTEEITPAQIEVLKDHGLNSRLEYVGVDRKTAEKNEEDFYMTRLLEFKLKGFSSLPKVLDVITKGDNGKKLNAPGTVMYDIILELRKRGMDRDTLNKDLKNFKNLIQENTIKLSTMKMAKVLTGSWWEDLSVDAKGNYTYNDLIIRTGYEKKYF